MTEVCENKSKFNFDIVSQYRGQIYGFAAIWVMLSHLIDFGIYSMKYETSVEHILKNFFNYGNTGVDIFLFLSGISLYFSYSKNKDYVYFIKRRMKRILPTFLIIIGTADIISLLNKTMDLKDFILSITTLDFWITGCRNSWYVSLIMMLYFIYPLLNRLIFGKNENRKYSGFRCIFLMSIVYFFAYAIHNSFSSYYSLIEIGLLRIPVFIAGTWFGCIIKNGKTSSIFIWALPMIGVFLFYETRAYCTGMWFSRFPYILGGISFSYILAGMFAVIKKIPGRLSQWILSFFGYTGKISLEFYLLHFMFFKMIPATWYSRNYNWVLGMIFVYVLAVIIHKFTENLKLANNRSLI